VEFHGYPHAVGVLYDLLKHINIYMQIIRFDD